MSAPLNAHLTPPEWGEGGTRPASRRYAASYRAEAHSLRWEDAPRARLAGDTTRARLLDQHADDLDAHAEAIDAGAPRQALRANARRLDQARAGLDALATRLARMAERPTLGVLRGRVAVSLRARSEGEHAIAREVPRTPSETATPERPCGVRVTRQAEDGRRIVTWTTCDRKTCPRCGPIVGAEHAAPILADARAGARLYVADVDEGTWRTLQRRIERRGGDAKRYPLAPGTLRVFTTLDALDGFTVAADPELELERAWNDHLATRPSAHVTGTRRWWREPGTVAAEAEAGTWADGSEWEVVTAGESYARAAAERMTTVRDLDHAPGWITAPLDATTDARLRHALGAIGWADWIDRCRARRRDGRALTPPVAVAA